MGATLRRRIALAHAAVVVCGCASIGCIASGRPVAAPTDPGPTASDEGAAVRHLVFTDALNQPRDGFQVTISRGVRLESAARGRFVLVCTSAEPQQRRKLKVSSTRGAWEVACPSEGPQGQPGEVEVPATPSRLALTPYYGGLLGLYRPLDVSASLNTSSDERPAYTMVIGFVQAGDRVEVHWGPPSLPPPPAPPVR